MIKSEKQNQQFRIPSLLPCDVPYSDSTLLYSTLIVLEYVFALGCSSVNAPQTLISGDVDGDWDFRWEC